MLLVGAANRDPRIFDSPDELRLARTGGREGERHLSFGLGVRDEPRRILRAIKGANLKEMRRADECCGFAGFFSMHFRDIAGEIGRKKIENISATSAETVVTSCPGCIMQLEALRREHNKTFRIKHIVEVIEESMPEK